MPGNSAWHACAGASQGAIGTACSSGRPGQHAGHRSEVSFFGQEWLLWDLRLATVQGNSAWAAFSTGVIDMRMAKRLPHHPEAAEQVEYVRTAVAATESGVRAAAAGRQEQLQALFAVKAQVLTEWDKLIGADATLQQHVAQARANLAANPNPQLAEPLEVLCAQCRTDMVSQQEWVHRISNYVAFMEQAVDAVIEDKPELVWPTAAV